jgi:serine-type D-Ala-D-Ala carboxypeptidase (penicillin-binding protein 5/6)
MRRKALSVLLILIVCCTFGLTRPDSVFGAQSTKPAAKKKPAQKSSAISKDPHIGAIVVDAATGRVLFEDNADAKGYPASVLKIMGLLIVLEKVHAGQLNLQDAVPVSAKASKTGGSQVWLAEKETFTVDELLYALMVQSANDAAVALAEKIGGTTEGFVELMNRKAREIGMKSTVFNSVHGLPPSAGQQHDITTARDFALLSRYLITKFPGALQYTSTREHTFRPNVADKQVIMRTHNHLLATVEGCDGLKTGYIAAAGFSIAVTAKKNNNQRVIVVVLGSRDRLVRDAKAKELLARGFAAHGSNTAAAPGNSTARPVASVKAPAPSR